MSNRPRLEFLCFEMGRMCKTDASFCIDRTFLDHCILPLLTGIPYTLSEVDVVLVSYLYRFDVAISVPGFQEHVSFAAEFPSALEEVKPFSMKISKILKNVEWIFYSVRGLGVMPKCSRGGLVIGRGPCKLP